MSLKAHVLNSIASNPELCKLTVEAVSANSVSIRNKQNRIAFVSGTPDNALLTPCGVLRWGDLQDFNLLEQILLSKNGTKI